MRLETIEGLRVTSPTDRFQAYARGRVDDPGTWYHLVQPAWSLDPFWLGHTTVRVRAWFSPHEVPLSRIEPLASRPNPGPGQTWQWQADRNAMGGRLASGGLARPWGIGVRASGELEFPLPPGVRLFRTRLGLDERTGGGGWVTARVSADPAAGTPLYASRRIGSSADVLDTRQLAFGSHPRLPSRLVLRVESAQIDRPLVAGSTDAESLFDWLEPLLELDPEAVKSEVARRVPAMIPAWQDWKVSTTNSEPIQLVSHWDETDPGKPAYRLVSSIRQGLLRLSGKLSVRPDRDHLVLVVSCLARSAPVQIEILVEGKPIVSYEVPIASSAKTPLLVVSLADYRGRQVAVDLVERSKEGEEALVDWRAIALRDQAACKVGGASPSPSWHRSLATSSRLETRAALATGVPACDGQVPR
jgi:hypothetical protein